MTFTYKLARRLARLKGRTAIGAMIAVAAIFSCELPVRTTDTGSTIAQLVVTPKNVTLQPNQVQDFMAVGFTGAGDTAQIAVTWSATAGTVETSSAGGRHYGHYHHASCGQFGLRATSQPGGLSDSATITVSCPPAPVASVSVSPASPNILMGQTIQLTATLRDANGNVLTGRTVTWSSNNAAASVNGTGLVTGLAAGSAAITATSEGQSGTASVTVSNVPVASVTVSPTSASLLVGQTVQLTATPKDANGNPLTGRVVSWSSNNTSVATVDGSGLVTAGAVGSATITAMSEGRSGTASITVTGVPVASVTVSPAAASVQAGQTQQLTATLKDASGNVLTGRTVTWSSGNTTVASVNGTGLVTAKVAGSATITASSEGQSGPAAITVTPVPVASVTVAPGTGSVAVGSTLQLAATPRDANGNPLTGRTITWRSSNATVASVNGSGLVTGVAVGGPVTITATSEGQSGKSAITVTPPSASVVLVGAGDIADCDAQPTAALLDNIPGTVFTAGDNAYPDGTAADYASCYDPSWGRHKARTRPAPGNHDYNTSGATGYYAYFGALAGPAGRGYYSYDLGAWHIVSLNSNVSMSAGSAQETWLRADLAASTKTCTIAY
ncbi:MAG TPA: Ig-like domain-containing protein, partial [Gemmatimonadales bacterium]|nr:Ig-like domain-containing protein [Gemmatimonadales bacterium]